MSDIEMTETGEGDFSCSLSDSITDSSSDSSYVPICEHTENECYKNCYYCECTCEQCIKDLVYTLEKETYEKNEQGEYIILDV